jgi:hypothetical protein
MDLKSIAAALTDAAARLDHLETENAELAKRLTAAQCEAFKND